MASGNPYRILNHLASKHRIDALDELDLQTLRKLHQYDHKINAYQHMHTPNEMGYPNEATED